MKGTNWWVTCARESFQHAIAAMDPMTEMRRRVGTPVAENLLGMPKISRHIQTLASSGLDGELTRQYWKHENVSDWKPGSKWEHIAGNGQRTVKLVGTVLECREPGQAFSSRDRY